MSADIHTDNLIVTNNEQATVGSIVMWHLYGDVELEKLKDSWIKHGLDPKLLPDLPSPEVCLTRAVDEFSGGTVFKRRIKGGGYRLVKEDQADKEIADYRTECSVKLDEQKKLVFTHFSGDDLSQPLQEAFDKHSKMLSSRDLSPWLCGSMMTHLKATSLKSNGGVYFVPRPNVDELGKIKLAIEEVSEHRVYTVKAMTDAEAVEMVLDAVIREAYDLMDAVKADLEVEDDEEEGTQALGARALENRGEWLQAMKDKVELFEELCQQRLESLHENLQELKATAMEAALAARQKKEEEFDD